MKALSDLREGTRETKIRMIKLRLEAGLPLRRLQDRVHLEEMRMSSRRVLFSPYESRNS